MELLWSVSCVVGIVVIGLVIIFTIAWLSTVFFPASPRDKHKKGE